MGIYDIHPQTLIYDTDPSELGPKVLEKRRAVPKALLIQLGAGLVRLLPPQHLCRKLFASCWSVRICASLKGVWEGGSTGSGVESRVV